MSLEDDIKNGAPLREHISPEGVEERVVFDVRYLVTQTQGGKFRFYSFLPMSLTYKPEQIHNTIDEATKYLGDAMSITGMIIKDPKAFAKKIMQAIFDAAPKKKDGK